MFNLQNMLRGLFVTILLVGQLHAQEKEKYLFGTEQQLEMIVHVFGEVRKPGEYRVPNDTNILELISKAGGPTQYSKLSKTRLTHVNYDFFNSKNGLSSESDGKGKLKPKRIATISLEKYLNGERAVSLPVLQPGDVVFVPRNNWFRWRNVVSVARDLSVIASVYFIYLRATKD